MKALEKLKEVTALIEICGIEAAEKHAEMLLRYGLNISTLEIFRDNPELSEEQINAIEDILERRLRGEPFQYIVGYEEFMGLKLEVGPGVLIPRPETEFMAEHAIKAVKSYKLKVENEEKNNNSSLLTYNSSLKILDVCTGCGCLALAIAREHPDLQVYGTDISEVAVEYAKRNARINRIENAVFLKGSLFQPVEDMNSPNSPSTFDLIISNPPYVRTDDIKNLQPEIKDWEPFIALNGGADGLDFYRELVPAARRFLKDEGLIMLEISAGQADRVADIIKFSGYTQIKTIKDYSGIERIMQATWKK